MLFQFSVVSALAALAAASPFARGPLRARENDGGESSEAAQVPNVVRSTWDGKCYYPTPDETFHLDAYLGKWYQIAGTLAPFTAGCSCTTAEYSKNDNGTVRVDNGCLVGDQPIGIVGTASLADAAYGSKGVLRVQFPGSAPPDCPGPNYIVQDYTGDFAIVQSNNFTTLFVLSRERNIAEDVVQAWIERAGKLGSDLTNVVPTDQSGCT